MDSAVKLSKIIYYIFLSAIFAHLLYSEISLLRDLGDAFSTDKFSEANAMRAAKVHVEEGFLRNYGLSCIGCGIDSSVFGPLVVRNAGVYTHYPPGPELLLGLYWTILDGRHMSSFRLFHVLFAISSLAFLIIIFKKRLGCAASVLLLISLLLMPATMNMAHGLHYQGNALSLLIIEIGLLWRMFGQPRKSKLYIPAFFVVGFIQGWLSFDYFFLVTFAPVPLWILSRTGRHLRLRQAITDLSWTILPTGAGFAFAHLLHVIQVAFFYHSLKLTVLDFRMSAEMYAGSSITTWKALSSYLFTGLPVTYFGCFHPLAMLLLLLLILIAGSAYLVQSLPVLSRVKIPALAAGSALIVSLGWISAMPQHALIHTHFIPRHLFLFEFVSAVSFLRLVNLRRIRINPN